MNSNYMFDFNRNSVAAPRVAARAAPKAAAPKAAPVAAPAAVASDRFSMNRLLHLKSTGGCRSCN
jgi:hypothetical protein